MKLALIADPHLSDRPDTAEEAAFDWALAEADELGADALAVLGDVTACGAPDAAIRAREKLRALSCPALCVPGNSDLRTPGTAAATERLFSDAPRGMLAGGVLLVGVDTAHGAVTAPERQRLDALSGAPEMILLSHHGPHCLGEDDRRFFSNWIASRASRGQRVLLWACGHTHRWAGGAFAGVRTVTLRALDPNKCLGGAPQLLLVHAEGGAVSWEERTWPGACLEAWQASERRELADALGVTCYRPAADMPGVIAHGVRHIEWRGVPGEALPLLRDWRRAGGATFSVHLPARFDGTPESEAVYRRCAEDAVRAGAEMVTVHAPYLPCGEMLAPDGSFSRLADAASRALRAAADAGVRILVENDHTPTGGGRDPLARPFGCTPEEIVLWRDALCERLGKNACGLRLDVGHARNNAPLTDAYPIGKWYALLGCSVGAYHLHQTVQGPDGVMHNHHPVTAWDDGGLIAFWGFLWAWRAGVLGRGPVILEIREGEGALAVWKRLQGFLLAPRNQTKTIYI